MAEKRILFADADTAAADEFCHILEPEWHVTSVASGMAALAEMQRQPHDVVVACSDLPELDGAELLNHIRVAYPKTIRFITAVADIRERAIGHVVGGHQFIAKPFDKTTLKSTIERSISADSLVVNATMRELVGRIRTFPTIPSLYLEVTNALNKPDVTTEEIGAIIGKDMAMTTKMLQVLNSAYFSLPQAITNPAEAVGILGFDTVKSLIISVKLMSEYDKIKPVYFSIDNIWRHSTNVAWIAKEFAFVEGGDAAIAASAYTAGLMHDLGKVILAANFDQQYSGAYTLARKQQMPLWEVEKEIFGASHGEIGAYLFGLWGMPQDIIEAAALHHHPSQASKITFSPLTAVHVANALEYANNSNPDDVVAPALDLQYLGELGLADRLDDWREAVCSSNSNFVRPRPRGAKSTVERKAQSAPPVPSVASRREDEDAAVSSIRRLTWINVLYVAVGSAAVICLLFGVQFTRLEHNAGHVALESPIPNPRLNPSPVAAALSHPPPPSQVQAVAPTAATEVTTVKTNAPPPPAPVPLSPVELAFNNLKLQGIFFSAGNPSALINGTLTHVNDIVHTCRVSEINADSVTFEFQGKRKTISLK
jgi:HD-like signal output (HDOD) protein